MTVFAPIRRLLSKLIAGTRRSQYSRPILFVLLFIVVCAILTMVFEFGKNAEFSTVLDGFWWAIITFSTTGYGDKVPITLGGRILAVLTIIIGVGATSLLSGGLASWLIDRNTRARRGLVDYSYLKNHVVICGWKNDMRTLLISILSASPEMVSDDIVLVSNVESDEIQALQDQETLRGLKFVRGDYYTENVLLRAGVRKARKIMVMADSLESTGISEVDSKTVLAVLTIKSITREVYVLAEVLDKKYEGYLRQASCDEIIFSRDVSRQLLANATATNGISHVFYELLIRRQNNTRLKTIRVPENWIDHTYGELKRWVEQNDNVQLIGMLENTGSPVRMKIESLREAQKTSDVSQLIANLQTIKGLEVNRPVLVPNLSYCVQRHSMGIVIERLDDDLSIREPQIIDTTQEIPS